MGPKEALFIGLHPIEAVKTFSRQVTVCLEVEAPPHTSNFQEFPYLPLHEAMAKVRQARREG